TCEAEATFGLAQQETRGNVGNVDAIYGAIGDTVAVEGVGRSALDDGKVIPLPDHWGPAVGLQEDAAVDAVDVEHRSIQDSAVVIGVTEDPLILRAATDVFASERVEVAAGQGVEFHPGLDGRVSANVQVIVGWVPHIDVVGCAVEMECGSELARSEGW